MSKVLLVLTPLATDHSGYYFRLLLLFVILSKIISTYMDTIPVECHYGAQPKLDLLLFLIQQIKYY